MFTPASLRLLASGLALSPLLLGCGPASLSEQLTDYRREIESVAAAPPTVEAQSPASPRLPRPRLRRIEVGDDRIGVFDFLAVVGCELSEVIAERNSGLGRVLEPTRRFAHEVAVIDAIDACLPSLGAERAKRLRAVAEDKRRDLPAHRWNAIWLDSEVERFLTDGPSSLVGGADPSDGPRQLARVARDMAERGPRFNSAESLEAAFRELRDDPAIGGVIREIDRARRDLSHVAARVAEASIDSCDRSARRLVRVFETHYLAIQIRLVGVDRRGFSVLEALDSLYRASAQGIAVPPAMQEFGTAVLDTTSEDGLWRRYRTALLDHAAAWEGPLQLCGVIDM